MILKINSKLPAVILLLLFKIVSLIGVSLSLISIGVKSCVFSGVKSELLYLSMLLYIE